MRVEATSVAEYLEKVDPARRRALETVAEVVRASLPAGFEEGLMYGAVAWFVPPERYGKSYNGQPLTAVALAAQKQHLGLYLHSGYMADELASVARGFAAAGKRLDMGKSCVRFRKAEDLALEVIGDYLSEVSVDRFVADYERGLQGRKQKPIVWRRPATGGLLATGEGVGAKVATSDMADKGAAVAKAATAAKSTEAKGSKAVDRRASKSERSAKPAAAKGRGAAKGKTEAAKPAAAKGRGAAKGKTKAAKPAAAKGRGRKRP